jgi:(E)-4-hydroxy-3-methylbut-2-enyl-diphosphate synthase
MIKIALKNNKPVRIGVNWGSLDQELFTKLMGENKTIYEVMVQSALNSAAMAEKIGMPKNKIVLSAKMSEVQDVIKVNQMLAEKSNYALHIGLTEAGMGDKGIVASSSALAILLQQGIGDTIRVSITPKPGASRTKEVEICQLLLQTMGLRQFRPVVTSCPGCGRTSGGLHRKLAQKVNDHINQNLHTWKQKYPGIESLKIAVMGCVVNGPGESRHADIGISLPGKTEEPIAPVYIEGKPEKILKGDSIPQEFISILNNYIKSKYN